VTARVAADLSVAAGHDAAATAAETDVYFSVTRGVVERFGDARVRYLVFLRRSGRAALDVAETWLKATAPEAEIVCRPPEGVPIAAKAPALAIEGPFSKLVEMETLLLQRVGPPCVAAANACAMSMALPKTAFLAMDARHCAGAHMAELMAYGAACGGKAAQAEGAVGFIGNATNATAGLFGAESGYGTMPHALIGYAGDTVRAVEMVRETFPERPLVALVDYFGREATDALAVCRRFSDEAARGALSVRLDTPGERYVEGLNAQSSSKLLVKAAPGALSEEGEWAEEDYMIGPGVSAAAVFHMRQTLDAAGFPQVKIVCSSGFNVDKCRAFARAGAPVDAIGTGSFLPAAWSDSYATADVVAYDGDARVKAGRDWLIAADPARG